jgi:hypothetical protein
MKLNDDALIALAVVCGVIGFLTIIMGGFYMEMEQNRLYQQTYNKSMECRIAFKSRSSTEMNEFCGKIPELGDFVK